MEQGLPGPGQGDELPEVITLRVASDDADSTTYLSREAEENGPELVVTYYDAPKDDAANGAEQPFVQAEAKETVPGTERSTRMPSASPTIRVPTKTVSNLHAHTSDLILLSMMMCLHDSSFLALI